ncbi:MAG: hypothetical protein RI894_1430 [Bacteroidota bacterium]
MVVKEVERILQHNIVSTLSQKLIQITLNEFKGNTEVKDLEDAFQFVVCRDSRAFCIVTANTKDFKNLFAVLVLHPSQYRALLQ